MLRSSLTYRPSNPSVRPSLRLLPASPLGSWLCSRPLVRAPFAGHSLFHAVTLCLARALAALSGSRLSPTTLLGTSLLPLGPVLFVSLSLSLLVVSQARNPSSPPFEEASKTP